MALLELESLHVRFRTREGELEAVRGMDLAVEPGECVAIVGESGSGKSQTLLAATGMLAANGTASGRVAFEGESLLGQPARLARVRGPGIGYVFQDALGSLTPHLTVGAQLAEALAVHHGVSAADARTEARRMLERVQVPDPDARLGQYPHELSGGTRQRVAIAAALMPQPRLLIADEPTTALDVTVQAQVVALFRDLRASLGMALVLVTHDLGVVAGLADRVIVMYAGRIVEEGPAVALFASPRHPYTAGLLAALPRLDDDLAAPMRTIPGVPPGAGRDAGCAFRYRCGHASGRCEVRPDLAGSGSSRVACHHPRDPGGGS
ncbi:MAG: ABC transporter ATP-binding protein [Steroidobacteraceae bacterium]|jgi:oligopeptide transport system ATP-binding protein|nr:ABC transporter ATP-binding protein [Steroidobacteraceae bacterium]